MREIKFRAWDSVNEVMENDIQIKDSFSEILHKSKYKVMQFSGNTDIKGCNIYAGDICKIDYNERESDIEQIEFKEDFFAPTYSSQPISTLIRIGIKFEIIGNIYENPELLK